MELGIVLFKAGQQVGEITERQFGIETAGNMQLGRAFLHGFAGDAQAIFTVMGVSVRLSWGSIEAAKLTINIANVGGIQVPVHIEVGGAAMFPAAHAIGQFAK